MCTISVHNLTHRHEGIISFSSPDNYWCAVYERTVKQLVKKSHNCKGIEATFAQSESWLEFLKQLQAADKGKDGKIDNPLMKGISGILLNLHGFKCHNYGIP